ncbi:MAG: hypothetical protein WA784_06070 [Albidovulum sp.]
MATQHAYGQTSQRCAARDAVLARLAETYGETRRSLGVAANSAVVEVFASDQTGTWTITVTAPNGITCLVASGDSFETMVEMPVALGSPA